MTVLRSIPAALPTVAAEMQYPNTGTRVLISVDFTLLYYSIITTSSTSTIGTNNMIITCIYT